MGDWGGNTDLTQQWSGMANRIMELEDEIDRLRATQPGRCGECAHFKRKRGRPNDNWGECLRHKVDEDHVFHVDVVCFCHAFKPKGDQ